MRSILGDSWPCTDGFLREITNKCRYVDLFYYNQHSLPEDCHSWWPKHVGGYADFSTINLDICISMLWLFLILYSLSEP